MDKVKSIPNYEFRLVNDFSKLKGEIEAEYIMNNMHNKMRRFSLRHQQKKSSNNVNKLASSKKHRAYAIEESSPRSAMKVHHQFSVSNS